MKEMYSLRAADAWKSKAAKRLGLMLFVAAAALGLCIFLCCRVNTKNAEKMMIAVMALSICAGWAVMLLYAYAYRPARTRAEHMRGILTGDKEMFYGVLQRTKEVFSIPKSVTVRKIALKNGEEKHLLHVDTALVRQLPPDGTRVGVETVRKFITAWEVIP